MQTKRIIIIGAGIGGLTAALALQRRGFKPVVYERAPAAREIGAGVNIAPNARRALRDLQIDQALEAISSAVPTSYLCDYATGEVGGIRWGEALIEKHGMGNLQVHRADLHELLLQAVLANDSKALHPGHEFIQLEQDEAGVTVAFADGAIARGEPSSILTATPHPLSARPKHSTASAPAFATTFPEKVCAKI